MDEPAKDTGTQRIELTVGEAMVIVIDYMKQGRLREAAMLCDALLELEPENADALHYAGVLAHKRGDHAEALRLIGRSLELVPEQPDWYSNLGIVLQGNGQFEAALEAFRRAVLLDPAHQNALNNLGVLQRLFGRLEEAEASYRTVIALNPDHPDVYTNLAVVLDQTGRQHEALTAYCKAITLRPKSPDAHRHLALAYSVIGEQQKAIEVCEEWLQQAPDDPRARHAMAAYSGRNVPPRASDAYVQRVFDDFAESFEAKLARLEYRAPALVAHALAAAFGEADGAREILDVGCGTGLCGPLLAPYARRLVGVDLSAGMLEHARAKQVYHELVQAELTAYLQQQRAEQFDAILSADTLVYFGELEAVVAAASAALRPGGVLIFTVEEATSPEMADSYGIQPHGRFTHGAAYVERLLASNGLEVIVERGELRLESGLPVQGLIVRGGKPGQTAQIGDAVAARQTGGRRG
jgi:predicted TPR repeat methyltransferase